MRFRLTVEAAVAEIVFDDGAMNLLSTDALRELDSLVASLPPLDALVFRSGRPRLFAAGADMAEMARFTAADAYAFAKLGQEVFTRIENLPCETTAMIDGDCFGGALDLVLAFDFRTATQRSRFAHPGARLGIVTGFGGTTRWRKVGRPPFARQMFLANRVFDSDAALSAGLIDAVV
jgi:enoyl-CoA hydratase